MIMYATAARTITTTIATIMIVLLLLSLLSLLLIVVIVIKHRTPTAHKMGSEDINLGSIMD